MFPNLIKTIKWILFLAIVPSFLFSATYYSQGDGNFGTTSNWNTARDGSGSSPTDFTSGDDFVIQDGHTITMDNVSNLIGNLIIENGGTFDNSSNTIVFAVSNKGLDVQSGGTYLASTGTIEINAGALNTVILKIASSTNFYNIVTSSKLTFDGANASPVFTINGRLKFSGASCTFTLQNGATIAYGSNGVLEYNYSGTRSVGDEWPTAGVPYVELNNGTASIDSGTRTVNTQLSITDGTLAENGGSLAYASNATLEYLGSTQQTVGVEWTSTKAPTNVKINNSSGDSPAVDLGSTNLASLSGNLILTQGSADYTSTGLSLTVSGDVVGGNGSFGIVNNNTLIVNGTNSAVTSSGETSLYNLTVTSSNGTVSSITVKGTLTLNPGSGNTIMLTGPLTLDTGANLTVSSGTLNMNGQQITKNGSNTLTLAANTQLTSGGSSIVDFATYALDATSTILLNGSASEDLPSGISYGNIEINKSAGSSAIVTGNGTATLKDGADLTILAGKFDLYGNTLALGNNSDMDIQGGVADLNGGTLSISTSNTNYFSLSSGATLYTGGTSLDGFDSYTTDGNVVFDGSVAETIPAGMTSFNNLTINNGLGVTASTDITVSGTLTLAFGTFTPTTATLSATLTTNGGNFSSSTGSVIFGGSSAQTINGSSSVTFYNFTINNAQGVTLEHDITVNGTVTLTDGTINTSGNLLSMGTGASFSGGSSSSYVEGRVAKTFAQGSSANFTFPTAKDGQYLPVGIAFTNISGDDYSVTVEQFNSDPHSISSSIDNTSLSAISSIRYWQIQGSGGTPENLQVTLTWNDQDGVDVPSALDVAQFDGSNWISIGGDGTGDSNGGTIQSAVFTSSGSYFTFGDDANNGQDNSLPVTLALFEAQVSTNRVILHWRTESEVDNLGFNIYRRMGENSDWQKLNTNLIPGAGNSSMAHEYSFVDPNVVPGETYSYRLESVNFNGHSESFEQKIQTVSIPLPKDFALFPNFPNPFNPKTTLRFQIPDQERISILIYDLKGNLIRHLLDNAMLQPGEHHIQWDATNDAMQTVASGTYVYRVIGKKQTKIGKMVFVK